MKQQGASFSSVLQQLASDHFNRVIGLAEYRAKRRETLDQIDQYYNGNEPRRVEGSATVAKDSDATTVPNQHSLGTTMTFSVDEILGQQPNEKEVDLDDQAEKPLSSNSEDPNDKDTH